MRVDTMPVKIKGMNLVPLTDGTGSVWGWEYYYNNWDTFWPEIKDSIDKAIDELGCNCFRLINHLPMIFSGASTRAEQLAKYEQFVDYVISRG